MVVHDEFNIKYTCKTLGIFSDFSGDLTAFLGFGHFLKIRLGTGVVYGPAPSNLAFQRPVRRPDAAFNIQTTGEFFMVKGMYISQD